MIRILLAALLLAAVPPAQADQRGVGPEAILGAPPAEVTTDTPDLPDPEEERNRRLPPGARRPRTPVFPLLHDPGAWRWVAEIFHRVMRAAEMTPHVPPPAIRDLLSGRRKGPRPEIPKGPDDATLLIIRHDEVNAFVTGSKLLVVTQGLLEFVGTDDELAGVIAHEVGHFKGGHIRRVSKKSSLLSILGTLAGVAATGDAGGAIAGQALGGMAALGYNRAAEFDADRRGVELMTRAGYHPVGILRFMERLREHQDLDLEDPLSVFVSTHPPSRHRAGRIRRMIKDAADLAAPAGLSYHFRREVYGVRASAVAKALAENIGAVPGEIDFEAMRRRGPPPPGPPPLLHLRLGDFQGLPRGFEVDAGTVLPLDEGLLLGPGAVVRGPTFEMDATASYLLSARVRARRATARTFLGLELLDAQGERLGVVYPGEAGTFVDAGDTARLTGVSHPFARREITREKEAPRARLLIATGRSGEGRVLLEEVGVTPVGLVQASGDRDTVGPR